MKLAFTTLGCPEWTLEEMISNALENGYQGIDFRGYLGEFDIYKLPEFSTEREETRRKFHESNLEIPCFSSSITLFTESDAELKQHLYELINYIRLCHYFDTPYIRVFGGHIKGATRSAAIQTVARNVEAMLDVLKNHGVTLLLETHDDWTKCDDVKDLFKHVDSSKLQVVWDVHHPFRLFGEQAQKTWEILGERIKYTHWKDSYVKKETDRGYQLCLLGEGDVPLENIFSLLKEKGYDGYYTLEWEKKWCPEIEEPEIAFKQFAEFMRSIAEQYTNA
ncbi:sugar phosphate isomerase/epimerase family protein [Bacillus gobiensis]|uniref:sugar phosphate isomerase/epimerase family protein n=1 Tax=Bacillus gobiensis TaxID=1441095 RepID=UPI003D1EAB4F